MNRSRTTRRFGLLLLAMFTLLAPGALSGSAVQVSDTSVLPSIGFTHVTGPPNAVVVSGSGFTPGGLVYVALYDRWGTNLFETHWIHASWSSYGVHGSQHPAIGYLSGGTFEVEFPVHCGASLMARAFDEQRVYWTSTLDIELTESACATAPAAEYYDPL